MPKSDKRIVKLLFILVIPILFACSENDDVLNEKDVIIINDYKMTKNEFQTQCTQEMKYSDTYKINAEWKKTLLDCIIRKELLIQEAKKLGIDKEDKFIAAIEKYWEATLIKLLMERKNAEIQSKTTISDKEIKKKYTEYKLNNRTLPPLNTIEKEIAAEILESKKTKILEQWLDDLHKNANIEIDEKIFSE